jgi:urease accessory protein
MGGLIRALRVVTADQSQRSQDTIELDFDHRHRRRMMMTTASGQAFLLDLPSATVLKDGDSLELDDGSLVMVKAKPERVADIWADSPQHLSKLAWHLGNRHLPTQVFADRLRILDDHVIVEMVRGLGATVDIVDAPFQPEGGAYAHPHNHGH